MRTKKYNLKRVYQFLEKIDFAFETQNFEKTIFNIDNQPENEPELAAEVTPDMIYRELKIELYPCFWKQSLDLQRKTLLHEMVHVILQNTKILASEALNGILHTDKEIVRTNEKAVSKVTHLLDSLLKKRLTYFTKAYEDYLK